MYGRMWALVSKESQSDQTQAIMPKVRVLQLLECGPCICLQRQLFDFHPKKTNNSITGHVPVNLTLSSQHFNEMVLYHY